MGFAHKSQHSDRGKNWVEPSILHAAETGDIDEALAAIKERPDCINDTDNNGMNALQIAIVTMRTEIALFLVNYAKVSALHEDRFGRNSHHLAYTGGAPSVRKAVSQKIRDEYEIFWSDDPYEGQVDDV